MDKLKRIYLSPSNQIHNVGVNGYNEAFSMRKLAEGVRVHLLKANSFYVRISDSNANLKQVCNDSNDYKADVHLCLHSDANQPDDQGTTCFVYGEGGKAKTYADILYKHLSVLSPGRDRGVQVRPTLYELRKTNAPAVLIEIFFHTNISETENFKKFFDLHVKETAIAICEMFGVAMVAPTPEPHWAEKYYNILCKNGITLTDKRFDDAITRGEAMALIVKSLKLK